MFFDNVCCIISFQFNIRIVQNGPGNGQTLALSPGKKHPSLTDQGVISGRQFRYKIMRVRFSSRVLDLVQRGIRPGKGDIVARMFQGTQDQSLLSLFDRGSDLEFDALRVVIGGPLLLRGRGDADSGCGDCRPALQERWQVLHLDIPFARQNNGALQNVTQLAYIPRPVVMLKRLADRV